MTYPESVPQRPYPVPMSDEQRAWMGTMADFPWDKVNDLMAEGFDRALNSLHRQPWVTVRRGTWFHPSAWGGPAAAFSVPYWEARCQRCAWAVKFLAHADAVSVAHHHAVDGC